MSVRADRRAAVLAAISALPETDRPDALLISHLPNVRYLTGFTGSNAILLLSPGKTLLVTDGRYATQVLTEADCPSRVLKRSLIRDIVPILKRARFRRIGLEGDHLKLSSFLFLQEQLPGVRLSAAPAATEALRMVKSDDEIAAIRASVALNSQAFHRAVAAFRPGMQETELAAEIDHQMRLLGAEAPAFETIVASGPRSALPHARPQSGAIAANQLLLIDMGALRMGYASDMTRMLFPGRPGATVRRWYRAMLESQLAAIDAVRHGAKASDVDGAARNRLKKDDLDSLFVHSTGHGLGLEIHEGPRIAQHEKLRLQAGMVITIEPGTYKPGIAGIRIEDTVLVTKTGCEILTPTPKELLLV